MKTSDDSEWFRLERLYEEARQFFLRGHREEAIDRSLNHIGFQHSGDLHNPAILRISAV